MRPGETAEGAAGNDYFDLRQSQAAWVPFFPPFTQAELPSSSVFPTTINNPLRAAANTAWERLPAEASSERVSLKVVLTALLGLLLLGAALTVAVVLSSGNSGSQQTSDSLSKSMSLVERSFDCSCDHTNAASLITDVISRGSDVSLQISTVSGVTARGSVGVLVQTTQSRSTRCIDLVAPRETRTWGFRVEGRAMEANATRHSDGERICVQFSKELPWPASYVTMQFSYSAPGSQKTELPFTVSSSALDSGFENRPYAIFPFLDDIAGRSASGSFSTLWNINVTVPAEVAVEASVAGTPLTDSVHTAAAATHIFRATASEIPSIELKKRMGDHDGR